MSDPKVTLGGCCLAKVFMITRAFPISKGFIALEMVQGFAGGMPVCLREGSP
jgi:hypothetical protein